MLSIFGFSPPKVHISCFFLSDVFIHKIYVSHDSLPICLDYLRAAFQLLLPQRVLGDYSALKLPKLLFFDDFQRKFDKIEEKIFEFNAAQSAQMQLDETLLMEETAVRELFVNLKKYQVV
jgi:hypothetical protein